MELLIFGFVFIVYFRTLFLGHVVDDVTRVRQRREGYFTNIFDYLYGGCTFQNKILDHAFTVVLHAIACVLIYKGFGSNPSSFYAAILYAVNPVNNQTSTWLNGRRYLINIILVLLMFNVKHLWPVFYLITPFFQVNALLTPILLNPLYILALPLALFLGRKKIIHWFKKRRFLNYPEGERKTLRPEKIIIFVKTIGYYFWLCLIPRRILFYRDFLFTFGLTKEGNKEAYRMNSSFWVGVTTLILIGFLIVKLWETPVSFGVGGWLLLSLQWGNILTYTMTQADRYMSLPNVFLMVALGWILTFCHPDYFIALAIIYVVCLFDGMEMYKDLDSFYAYHIYHDPKGIPCRTFKARAEVENKDFTAAFETCKPGLHHNPNDFNMFLIMSLCCAHLRAAEQSIALLKKAEENMYLGQEDRQKKEINQLKKLLGVERQ